MSRKLNLKGKKTKKEKKDTCLHEVQVHGISAFSKIYLLLMRRSHWIAAAGFFIGVWTKDWPVQVGEIIEPVINYKSPDETSLACQATDIKSLTSWYQSPNKPKICQACVWPVRIPCNPHCCSVLVTEAMGRMLQLPMQSIHSSNTKASGCKQTDIWYI